MDCTLLDMLNKLTAPICQCHVRQPLHDSRQPILLRRGSTAGSAAENPGWHELLVYVTPSKQFMSCTCQTMSIAILQVLTSPFCMQGDAAVSAAEGSNIKTSTSKEMAGARAEHVHTMPSSCVCML